MASKYEADSVLKGTITFAIVSFDKNDEPQLEVGVNLTHKVLGDTLADPTEEISQDEITTFLYLGKMGDKADTRRGISRQAFQTLTGEKLDDDWTDKGYFRLQADHKKSIIPQIEGKDVLVKVSDDGKYLNLYFKRPKPVAQSLADLRKKMAERAAS